MRVKCKNCGAIWHGWSNSKCENCRGDLEEVKEEFAAKETVAEGGIQMVCAKCGGTRVGWGTSTKCPNVHCSGDLKEVKG